MAKYSADLHVHTTASDSSFGPLKLIEHAKAANMTTIAVTDHDCVDAVHPARVAGEKLGIRVIAGVEMSAAHEGVEVHLVGLFLDVISPWLLEMFKDFQKRRTERIGKICQRLREHGVELGIDDVKPFIAESGAPSRVHVAQALAHKGCVQDVRDAFQNYIGDDGPGYVPKNFMSMQDAIAAIRRCGGVAVFAHPGLTRHDELLPVFAQMGGKALEVYYPAHSARLTKHYLELGRELGLLPSGGSDCHGRNRPDLMLGKIRLPEYIVDDLENAARLG